MRLLIVEDSDTLSDTLRQRMAHAGYASDIA